MRDTGGLVEIECAAAKVSPSAQGIHAAEDTKQHRSRTLSAIVEPGQKRS